MNPTEDLVETTMIIPPEGGWGWVVVLTSFFTNFMIDGTLYTFGIFLETIGESFDVHPTQVAVSSSIMTGFYSISAPINSILISRFGFRMVAFMGGIISATAFLSCTIVTSIYSFMILFGVIGGIGFGMVYLPAIVIVGYYFEKWRSLATSMAVTGSATGIMLFPLIFKHFLNDFHWITKFYFISGGCMFTSLLAFNYVPVKPVRVLTRNDKVVQILGDVPSDTTKASTSDSTPPQRPKRKKHFLCCLRNKNKSVNRQDLFISTSLLAINDQLLDQQISQFKMQKPKVHLNETLNQMLILLDFKLLKSPSFVLLVMSSFTSFLGIFIPFTYVTQRAHESGISAQTSYYLYTALGISSALGRILSGICSSIPRSTPLIVSYISISTCGITTMASYLLTDIYSQFVHISIFGLTSACIAAIRAPIVADMLGLEHLTSAYAILMVFYGLAGFMGLPIAGAIIRLNHSYNISYLYSGFVLLLSAIMLMPIKRINDWEKRNSKKNDEN